VEDIERKRSLKTISILNAGKKIILYSSFCSKIAIKTRKIFVKSNKRDIKIGEK
jgi:hypothetical protein